MSGNMMIPAFETASSTSDVPEEIASAASISAAAQASADAHLSELSISSSDCFILFEWFSYALLVSKTLPFSSARVTDCVPLLDLATFNDDFSEGLIFSSSLVTSFPIFTALLNSSYSCSAKACVDSFAAY
uniref:Uncharacterized protein n=1 Tax=Arundo donax TaxID=35708 RepID=A0A0A9F252_ARUDO